MRLVYRVPLLCLHFVLASVLGLFLSALRPFRPSNSRMCAQLYARGALPLINMRVEHIDTDNFPIDRPFIAVSNHQSNWDLVVVGSVVPARTVSVGKKSLRWVPFFGQLYWLAGNVMIDRSNRTKALEAMAETRRALREKLTNIWIFPEGTRNHGKNMLPFKKGAFFMAIDAGVPIVPVCCSAYLSHLSLARADNGCARLAVLPPVETDGLTADDVERLMADCHALMTAKIEALSLPVST